MIKKLEDTGGEKDRPEGSKRVEKLSYLIDGTNRRCFPQGKKGMQRPGKIENTVCLKSKYTL